MRYYIWYLITSEPDMIDIANVFGSLGNSDFNFCNLQVIYEFKIRDELSETNGIYYYKEFMNTSTTGLHHTSFGVLNDPARSPMQNVDLRRTTPDILNLS